MMKTVVLSLNEKQAKLVLNSVRACRDHMASDHRHEDDRRELRAVEIMLDAEMKIACESVPASRPASRR